MDKNFEIKDNILIKYTGTDSIVKIPEGITTIKRYCFENNEYIKEIILPQSTDVIGRRAFFECKNLEKINLENVTIIRSEAFYKNKNLKNININNVQRIETKAFMNCGIEYLNLHEKLNLDKTELVFCACNNLKTIVINCKIDKTDSLVLGCQNLNKIILNNNGKITSRNIGVLINTKEIETNNPNYIVEDGMLYNSDKTELVWCPQIINKETYKIPDTVRKIGESAFANHRSIKKLKFGENVIKIEKSAFINSDIENIEFNSNLKEICDFAFFTFKTKQIDLSNTDIEIINLTNSSFKQINNKITLILPKNLKKIITNENDKNNIIINTNKTREEIKFMLDNDIEIFESKYQINYRKTLEELIEEGKTFRQASKVMKEQER